MSYPVKDPFTGRVRETGDYFDKNYTRECAEDSARLKQLTSARQQEEDVEKDAREKDDTPRVFTPEDYVGKSVMDDLKKEHEKSLRAIQQLKRSNPEMIALLERLERGEIKSLEYPIEK